MISHVVHHGIIPKILPEIFPSKYKVSAFHFVMAIEIILVSIDPNTVWSKWMCNGIKTETV